MRLTKPTLFTNIPVTCEEKDLPGMLCSACTWGKVETWIAYITLE